MKLPWICPVVCAVFIAASGVSLAFGAADAASSAPSNKPPAGPPERVDGYLKVGFDRLASFPFKSPDCDSAANPNKSPTAGEEQIPAAIKQLSGKKVIVTGFMLPIKVENGLATEFLLMKSQLLCCYGITPSVNEWVLVTLKSGVKPRMDVPVSCCGTLRVGAMFEHGFLTGIYALDGEKMVE